MPGANPLSRLIKNKLVLYTRGGQTFFVYGANFIKILFFGPKNFFGLFFLKYDIIDVNLGYFSYINS